MKMKKTMIAELMLVLTAFTAHAEAPELKNVYPNYWDKITEVTGDEKSDFLKKQSVVINKFGRGISIRLYKQVFDKTTFYRCLLSGDFDYAISRVFCDKTLNSEEWEKFSSTYINQALFIENSGVTIYLGNAEFGSFDVYERGDVASYGFEDFLIRRGKKECIKIIKSKYIVGCNITGKDSVKVDFRKRKGQIYGYDRYFRYLSIDDPNEFCKVSQTNSEDIWYDNLINIKASDFLFAPKCPLRYSLQNAFNGDPATSYVENTEDDLMEITFQGCFDYKKIRIVNGYAQNKGLYLDNNRVRKINGHILSDNIMDGQQATFDEEQTSVEVQDVYKGKNTTTPASQS